MKQKAGRFISLTNIGYSFFVLFFYLIGSVFGSFFSYGNNCDVLLSFQTDLFSSFLSCLFFPFLSVILGHCVFGFIFLPFISFAQGFLLSFISGSLIFSGYYDFYFFSFFSEIVSASVFIFLSSYSFCYSFALFYASFFQSPFTAHFSKKRFFQTAASLFIAFAAALIRWILGGLLFRQ